jgi:hypothetical protein
MPKILLTVTAIATLAAAAGPVVSQYVDNGPTASTVELQQLQHAVAGFTTDVRHYPGDLQQLVTPIVATRGQGDSLDFDGASMPIHFSGADAARWKGPYTRATISTDRVGGGRFTSANPPFTIGRTIKLSGAWLTVPIVAPKTCADLLALNNAVDRTPPGADNEAIDGVVVWGGTCSADKKNGTVTNPVLRLAPAN